MNETDKTHDLRLQINETLRVYLNPDNGELFQETWDTTRGYPVRGTMRYVRPTEPPFFVLNGANQVCIQHEVGGDLIPTDIFSRRQTRR